MITSVKPVLKQLFSAYPNSQITEETVAVYVRALANIPLADLQTVVDQCIAECKFLPTVAELNACYRALTCTLNQPTAAEAWGTVEQAFWRQGRYVTPKFDNPLTARVVAIMGWLNLCNSETPGVERAQFMRIYEQLAERQEAIDRLLPQARQLLEDSAAASGPKRISQVLAEIALRRAAPSPAPVTNGHQEPAP